MDMMRQQNVFDWIEAQDAKKSGIVQSEDNASPDFTDYMLQQVRLVCLEQPRLTSDDVFERAEADPAAPSTHDLRAFGPVMMRAAKLGFCKKANVAPVASRRKSLHASPRAVWDSLIFKP